MPKISDLTAATTVGDTDELIVVQSGETKRAAKSLINSADGDVTGPETNTANNIPQWNGADSKALKDGLSLVTTVGATGADTALVSEQGVREAIAALGTAPFLTTPATNTANNIPQWDGANSQKVKDGLALKTTVGATGDDTAVVSEQGIREAIANYTTSPATNTDNYIPQWDGANSKLLKDGLALATAVGATGTDTTIVSEQGIREAIDALGTAPFVTSPATNTADYIPQWDGANSKLLKDGLSLVTTVGATGVDTAVVSEQGVRESIANFTTSPATNTDNYIPQWDGANSKLLKDGVQLKTTVGATGDDTSVVTEQGIREAIDDFTTSPATNTADYIPQWDGANSKTLKDGLSLVTTVGATGVDTAVVSEQGIREAIDAVPTGDVSGPGSNTADNIPQWDGADSKTLKDGLGLVTTVGATPLDTNIVTEQGVSEALDLKAPKLFTNTIASSTGTLSAAQVSGVVLNNYTQSTANTQTLPAAAVGYNGMIVIATAGAGSFHLKAGAGDKIYLDGTALSDGDKVTLATPTVGDYFSFWSFQTGATAYDWLVASGQGTLTDGGA